MVMMMMIMMMIYNIRYVYALHAVQHMLDMFGLYLVAEPCGKPPAQEILRCIKSVVSKGVQVKPNCLS